MFKDLINLLDTESPLAWVVGSILAIYLAIKVVKDVSGWVKSAVDAKKKEFTDSQAICQAQDRRILALETEFKTIRADLTEIKQILKLKPGA